MSKTSVCSVQFFPKKELVMHIEAGVTYHLYNQGNNKRRVFLEPENYAFFQAKMRQFLLPFGNLFAYCLMPNHFHWLFQVKHERIVAAHLQQNPKDPNKPISLNSAIGTLLRSYTRAMNKRYQWSGSLFRQKTQAKGGIIDEFITGDSRRWKENDYLTYCFHYIHENPVKAGLVAKPEEWPYSSACEYAGRVKNGLCRVDLWEILIG